MRSPLVFATVAVLALAASPSLSSAQRAIDAPARHCAEGSRCDRREDVRDRREDVRDRREDVRDAQHQGGRRDRIEDRRDRSFDGQMVPRWPWYDRSRCDARKGW